jgi:hypothetical protein
VTENSDEKSLASAGRIDPGDPLRFARSRPGAQKFAPVLPGRHSQAKEAQEAEDEETDL